MPLGALNALPITVLFLGVGTLAFGLIPREVSGIAFGAVTISYLVEIVGGDAAGARMGTRALAVPSPRSHARRLDRHRLLAGDGCDWGSSSAWRSRIRAVGHRRSPTVGGPRSTYLDDETITVRPWPRILSKTGEAARF